MESIVRFTTDEGTDVQITPQDVKNLICHQASDKEVALFLELCRAQRLNPFIRDVYLVKYGSNPASIITGKEVFTKRANRQKGYQGFEAGVVVIRGKAVERREGSAFYPELGERLIGGWARVFVDGRRPFYDEVTMAEYSTGKSNWSKMPATMIRKVAVVHCLREAFPDAFQGLYSSEEMDRVAYTGEVRNVGETAAERTVDAIQAVPMMTDEQAATLNDRVCKLAELRHVPVQTAYDAVIGCKALKALGAEVGAELTEEQADAAIEQAGKWVEAAVARQVEAYTEQMQDIAPEQDAAPAQDEFVYEEEEIVF